MATVSHTPPPTEPRSAVPGPLQLAAQFTLGVLLLVAVGLLGWMLFGYFTDNFQSVDAKRADERRKILSDRQTEDHKYLYDAPSWFAKDKGLVRVPIDEAMRMTLPELQKNKPHAAYPIATPPSDSGAPTSPDKGAGSKPGVNTNPAASNPTAGHPVPTPVPNATPTLPAAVKSSVESTPAPGPAQSAAPEVPAPTPLASAAPTAAPAASLAPAPVPVATPAAVESPAQNANNPGSAPIPGTQAQPTPTPTGEAAPTPAVPSTPVAAPAASATPATSAGSTPPPVPHEPGASPAGTR